MDNAALPRDGATPAALQKKFDDALLLVDDIVLKSYLTRLTEMDVLPLGEQAKKHNLRKNVRVFKITEMVYAKDEFAAHKLASVFGALSGSGSSVFLVLDSDGVRTDFYLGVRTCDPENRKSAASQIRLLERALRGQFPGAQTKVYAIDESIELAGGFAAESISAVSMVAGLRSEETRENAVFLQGLEKFAVSMRGEKYSAVILAESIQQWQVMEIRRGYENIYTHLSPMESTQLAQGTNWSANSSVALTVGSSRGSTVSPGYKTHAVSKENTASKVLNGVSAAAGVLGAALAPATGGISFIVGGAAAAMAGLAAKAAQKSETGTEIPELKTHNEQENLSEARTEGTTAGVSDQLTVTVKNKTIANMLERVDGQLKRLGEFEGGGCWSCAAYFTAPNNYAAELAAANYRSMMSGSKTGLEISAVNTWGGGCDKLPALRDYIGNFMHPVFDYPAGGLEVTPGSFVSSAELALHMGLPRRSVPGFPVIEHADFAQEVISGKADDGLDSVTLGCVYSMGRQHKDMPVRLNRNHLASHVFVTGSTGKGKSNAIYGLLDRLCPEDGGDMRFLVIEPIKGEYKTVFGGRRDVSVYGTNPYKTPLLRMNPFSFPGDIHVLEHIDRLVEIFNACWPMYAAMPAILKKAVENAYVRVGWSLRRSVCLPLRFPTFAVLLDELPRVIDGTSYSKDTGSDYKGALMTRVSSLAEGTYDQIFNNGDIPGEELFDGCVIADLSRMGSAETKALMMGILLLKLQEYRMANAAEGNAALRHVTVLEEAHCLLRRTSFEQGQESANLLGKSVEMLSNSIAEMRTYGEGFIIADQSPGLLDMSAIRNTNTKILLGLPEAQDRELAGRAAGMNDDQISELAKLETGVAAVYQSGWAQPLLCKITHFEDKHKRPFVFKPERAGDDSVRRFYALALGCEDAEPLTAEDADALRSWRDRQLTDMPTLALIDAVLASRALSLAQRQILAYNLLCGKRAALYLAQEASAEKIQTFLADQMCVSPEDALTQRAFRLVMEEIHALLEDGGDKDKVEQILRVEGYR